MNCEQQQGIRKRRRRRRTNNGFGNILSSSLILGGIVVRKSSNTSNNNDNANNANANNDERRRKQQQKQHSNIASRHQNNIRKGSQWVILFAILTVVQVLSMILLGLFWMRPSVSSSSSNNNNNSEREALLPPLWGKRMLRQQQSDNDDEMGKHDNDDRLRVIEAYSQLHSISVTNINNNQTDPPLDDFYRRAHIIITGGNDNADDATRKQQQQQQQRPPVLVVGGSDGSGTRAVVDILGRLGAPMLIDDGGTLDVHAASMFDGRGWPPLIQLILQITHSANYNVTTTTLPPSVLAMALQELQHFKDHLDIRGDALRREASLRTKDFAAAQNVQYGFKAPAAMLVLPLLHQVWGRRLKFIHVVRDGRDVALSSNTSPVDKFYNAYYDNAEQQRQRVGHALQLQMQPTTTTKSSTSSRNRDHDNNDNGNNETVILKQALAMQLWNDWNAQVLTWARQHNDGTSFDYLVVRAEDLLEPETKRDTMQRLADFVGSQRNHDDLCCLCQESLVDMGASSVMQQEEEDAETRFGLKRFRSAPPSCFFWRWMEAVFGQTPPLDESALDEKIGSSASTTGDDQVVMFDDEQDVPFAPIFEETERREDLGQEVRQKASVFDALHRNRLHQHDQLVANRKHRQQQLRRRRLNNIFLKAPLQQVQKETLSRVTMLEEVPETKRMRRRRAKLEKALEVATDPGTRQILEKRLAVLDESNSNNQQRSNPLRRRHATPDEVKKRYGKWRIVLQDQPQLSSFMHRHGAEALKLFGYEPPRRFADAPPRKLLCDPNLACERSFPHS